MQIERISIHPSDNTVVHEPMLRASLVGCDLPECHCSDTPFLLISDGNVLLTAQLDEYDVRQLREALNGDRRLELYA